MTRSRRVVVDSIDALVERPLRDGVNALCWPRALAGDFDEVARLLAPDDGIVDVGSSRVDLQACKLEYSIVSPK